MPEEFVVPKEAKLVWKYLTLEERERINKHWPFREERNELIRELWRRGVKQTILSEITNLTKVSIWRICNEKRIREKERRDSDGSPGR